MLLKYQTNWPMIPFYFQDFISLVKDLMRLFLKPEILDTILTGKELQKGEFTKKENLIPIGSVTVCFAAECTWKDLKEREREIATNIWFKEIFLTM